MNKRMRLIIGCLAILLVWQAITQAETIKNATVQDIKEAGSINQPADDRANRAMLAPDYPVTAGDIYQVSYQTAAGLTTIVINVNLDRSINLGNIGVIDARSQTFAQTKSVVEKKISQLYPLSTPVMTIRSVGTFDIIIRGEVTTTTIIKAWSLMRLHEIIANTTPWASFRDIQITSVEGTPQSYDLFKYQRQGDLSQDPCLRSGDIVTFGKYAREVRIAGEVRRPGTYQLLSGESISELINQYADGYTARADQTHIEITRNGLGSQNLPGQRTKVQSTDFSHAALIDQDTVMVPAIAAQLPVATIESALSIQSWRNQNTNEKTQRNWYAVPFYPGDTIRSLFGPALDSLPLQADLEHIVLTRADGITTQEINVWRLITARQGDDPALRDGDKIFIPTKEIKVFVSGAVTLPGGVEWIPGKTWEYYVMMAGGFTADNSGASIVITNKKGQRLDQNQILSPEDRIEAIRNSPAYIQSTFIAIFSTIITIFSNILIIGTNGHTLGWW